MTQINELKDKSLSVTDDKINGVQKEFITSYGSYIVLQFDQKGRDEGKNVYIHKDKTISKDQIDTIMGNFKQHRIMTSNDGNSVTYEAFDEDFAYVSVNYNTSTPKQAKIDVAIGFDGLDELIKSLGEYVINDPQASWVTGFDQYGEVVSKPLTIKGIKQYYPEFYPSMQGEDIEDFAKRYIQSESSVLLLIGEPGTGKTNFIRSLLSATKESVLLTYSKDIGQQDKLFSHFYDCPERFLIIEDADTYISARKDGNDNMKQLLNITDGLTANPTKKVIFSTNLPSIKDVDSALLRAGRCFQVINFNKLKGEDLLNANKVVGVEGITQEYADNNPITIGELFAIKNGERGLYINESDEIKQLKGGIGFVK